MRRTIAQFCTIAVLLIASPSFSNPPPISIEKWPSLSRSIDHYYADIGPHQSGAITAVIHKGEVIHLKGYGAANRELDIPWTPDTVYLLASLTKSITASAVLELIDQGTLSLADPIQKYVPDFPIFDSTITIRHAISMTSGLWQDELLLPLSGISGQISLEKLYGLSQRQTELEFEPGANVQYTDTNFRLLARAITKATGASDYSHALKQLLFEPLSMHKTSAPEDYWRVENGRVQTYVTLPGAQPPPYTLDIHVPTSGDGGVRTTMRDLIKWFLYMREGVEAGTSRWQRLDQTILLKSGQASWYGLGVYHMLHRGLRGIAHGGFTGTYYVFYPEIDLIIAFFQNDIGLLDSKAVIQMLTDAFLFSDQYDKTQLSRSPLWLRGLTAELEPIHDELIGALPGNYVEPDSGAILRLTKPAAGRLDVAYKSAASWPLQYNGDGRFKTYLVVGAPRLEVISPVNTEPTEIQVRQVDWTEPRTFKRANLRQEYREPKCALSGFYYSPVLDVFYSVRYEENAYVLRIGSGEGPTQKFRLSHLLDNIYQADAIDASYYDLALGLGVFGVRVHADDDGEADAISIITDRISNIEFQRVRIENK